MGLEISRRRLCRNRSTRRINVATRRQLQVPQNEGDVEADVDNGLMPFSSKNSMIRPRTNNTCWRESISAEEITERVSEWELDHTKILLTTENGEYKVGIPSVCFSCPPWKTLLLLF